MANNMVRVKPTVVTAHNNTLPSRNTASNTGTARKPASADNQDMVDQHQVTDKDHHKQAHQAAMDNKLATEVRHMAHRAALTAAQQTMITTSTTNTVVRHRMGISMAEASSILLLLVAVVIRLVATVVRLDIIRLSRAGSRFLFAAISALRSFMKQKRIHISSHGNVVIGIVRPYRY
jgi:hypothetical protein